MVAASVSHTGILIRLLLGLSAIPWDTEDLKLNVLRKYDSLVSACKATCSCRSFSALAAMVIARFSAAVRLAMLDMAGSKRGGGLGRNRTPEVRGTRKEKGKGKGG
jgi:hypothetical protein